MNRLKAKYQKEILPQLKKELRLSHDLAVPRILKIIINMGVTDPADPKQRRAVLENISKQFEVIAGQKPMITLAKNAISGFKLRAGDPLGLMVTLRGERMWQFLDKLIAIVLPRVKDFRGVSVVSFDGQGNYSLGLEEQIVFPEIEYDQIEKIRGLQINIVSSTKINAQAYRLLELLGMPFSKEKVKEKK